MRLLEMNHIKKSFDGQEVLKDISIHVDAVSGLLSSYLPLTKAFRSQ